MSHSRRKLQPADVLTIRSDKALRTNAEQMLRLAQNILRTVPTSADHARRLGISGYTASSIARGLRYKEVRP